MFNQQSHLRIVTGMIVQGTREVLSSGIWLVEPGRPVSLAYLLEGATGRVIY